MNRNAFRKVARSLVAAASFITLGSANADAQSEIVLHTKNASRVAGDWQMVADGGAASGVRLWNPDRGAAKLASPFASPTDYFELTFNAEAYRPYRLWVRGKADNNAWTNDSVFLQFSSSMNAYEQPISRIGTSSATVVSVEACSGCGLSGWGWEDNGYSGSGPVIYFATAGPQTLRVQRREDGVSIDQIVLSGGSYYNSSPGAVKNDGTILSSTSGTTTTTTTTTTAPAPAPAPTTSSTTEIVVTSAHLTGVSGTWRAISDSTAAGGRAVGNPDQGAAKISTALASPTNYAEFTFSAEAGKAYRVWIRGKADNNYWANDSVFVQFNGSVTTSGSATARIGTTSALTVNLEEDSGYGVSGWGWQDNGYGAGVLGPLVAFSATGTQRMRVQTREDGFRIDQIVLSASTYLTRAPGATKNDSTILAGGTTTTAPAPEPEPAPAPAPAPSSSTSGVRIRVLEWNVHHGAGTDNVVNLDRLTTWMAALRPDVVLLNEVEKYTYWGNMDQPAVFKSLLQQKTGRTYYSHFSQEFGQWSSNGKGHQILSVYPFDSVSHTTITPSSGLKGAGAASQAAVTINGRTVNFILSHLDPYDQAMRLTQAQDVIRWASGFAENRIISGDMNAWPDQASILEYYKTYYDSWTVAVGKGQAYASSGITPYGATKNGRIDYILFSRNAPNLVVIDSQVYDTRDSSGVMPSDHRPIVTTFEVR